MIIIVNLHESKTRTLVIGDYEMESLFNTSMRVHSSMKLECQLLEEKAL